MSLSPNLASIYAKSLFQDIIFLPSSALNLVTFPVIPIIQSSERVDFSHLQSLAFELELISGLIMSSPRLKKIFEDPTYSEFLKCEIVHKALPDLGLRIKIFLHVLREQKHIYLMPTICSEFSSLLWKAKKYLVLNLTISGILPKKFGKKVVNQLSSLAKTKEIILRLTYNPKILGGVIIEYNSYCLDLSICKEFSYFFTNF